MGWASVLSKVPRAVVMLLTPLLEPRPLGRMPLPALAPMVRPLIPYCSIGPLRRWKSGVLPALASSSCRTLPSIGSRAPAFRWMTAR